MKFYAKEVLYVLSICSLGIACCVTHFSVQLIIEQSAKECDATMFNIYSAVWFINFYSLFIIYNSVIKPAYCFTLCHKSLLNARTCITFPLSSLINFNGNGCSLQKNSTFDPGTKFISFPSHSCLRVI